MRFFADLMRNPVGNAPAGQMPFRRHFKAGLCLLAGLWLAGCEQTPPPAPPQRPPAPVGVVTVHAQPVTLTTELSGRTAPYKIADVRPQINGIVKKRLFQEGADVEAGETLYIIDPAVYQTAYDSARANLAHARANLVTVRLKAERYADLIKINAVSHQDVDDINAALRQAEADVVAGVAAVDAARINLEYTRITAPIPGRIGISTVTPGALLVANQATALTTIQQTDPIYVDVVQPTTELIRMKHALEAGELKRAGPNAAKVGLLLEDGTHYPQEGTLELSDITVSEGTGTVTLRAVFPNPNHDLLPGMFVRAVLDEGVDEHGIRVPQQGVTHDNRGNATALVLKDGKVELRLLELGEAQGDQWVVRKGLQPGDQLIVDGLQKVKPGAPAVAVPVTLASAAVPAAAAAAVSASAVK